MKKGIFKKATMKEKLLVLMLMGFLFFGTTTAGWILFYEPTSATGLVISSEGIDFSDSFSISNLTADNIEQSITESITIDNPDGTRSATVFINTSLVDISSDSCDNSGDVNVSVDYLGNNVANGGVITIGSDTTHLNVTTTVQPFACPQNATTTIQITE